MTAGKNQAQPIILKAVLFIGTFRRTPLRFEISHELVLRRIKSCPSTQSINGFESGRRNQPWSRVAGYSTPRPQAQRSRKGLVHRLFGKIKIAEQADQSCQDPPRIHAIKRVEQFAYLVTYLLGGTLGHDDDLSKPTTPNQFGKRRIDAKCSFRAACFAGIGGQCTEALNEFVKSAVVRNLQQPQFRSDTFRILAAAGQFPTLASSFAISAFG